MALVTGLSFALTPAIAASGYPEHVPASWRALDRPAWFREALCIHGREGAWNDPDSGGGGNYGGLQIQRRTWASVGGVGSPDKATPREQLYRAWLITRRDRHDGLAWSWREWPNTARVCGARR